MNNLELTSALAAIAAAAGFLGSLTGLGGGVVIVPVLTLLFHVDIRYAIGASLVSVIATSSGAAAAYVREGFTNIRLGMFLEIATSLGALAGAWLASVLPAAAIGSVFGAMLLYSAWESMRAHEPEVALSGSCDPLASWLALEATYPGPNGPVSGLQCAPGLRPDGRRRHSLRAAGHRIRGGEGRGDGPGDAPAVQGFHHNQQFHDRGHSSRERRRIPQPRLHRSRAFDAGHAGRAGGVVCRGAGPLWRKAAHFADAVRRGHRRPGHGDDLQQRDRQTLR